MVRSRGRRTAPKQPRASVPAPKRYSEVELTQSNIPRWLWLVLVLLSIGCLGLAGMVNRPAGVAVRSVAGVGTGERSLVCGGGLAGAQMITATGGDGAAISQALPAEPTVVSKKLTSGSIPFASLWRNEPRFLSFSTCPEPRANWWVLGVGGSDTHPATLILDNPRSGVAVVDVQAFNANGPVEAPGLRGITIAPGKRQVLDLRQVIPSATDLAVQVVATRGLVTVTSVDRWSDTLIGKPVSEWVPGQPRAATDLVITGLPAKPQQATLLVANPRDTETIVRVRAIGISGTFSPDGATTLTVPARSLGTLNLKPAFDGNPVAIRLTSAAPIAATVRAVVPPDQTYGQVATPFQTTVVGLPPVGRATVLLSSLGNAAQVQVQSFANSGQPIGEPINAEVAAGTTVGVELPPGVAWVRLETKKAKLDPEGVVAGVSITAGKGIGGAAFPVVAEVSALPMVVPGW